MSQNPGTVSHSRVMDVYFAGIYGNNMGFDQSPRKNWGSIQILRHALQFFLGTSQFSVLQPDYQWLNPDGRCLKSTF